MRRVLLSVSALLTAALSLAHQGSVTGQYQLRVPDDAARVARLAGRRSNGGRLALHVNNRFTLEVNEAVRHGRYRVDGDHLTLYLEDGTMMGGLLRGERIQLEGLTFEHGSTPIAPRRFPTDGATGRLRRVDGVLTVGDPAPTEAPAPRAAPVEIPTVRPAPPTAVFSPDPVTPTVPPAVVTAVPARRMLKTDDCCGAWTVRAKGQENKTQRMELRADGTFRFAMLGATSEGTWTVDGYDVVLIYTKVDGQPLEEGASGKKRIPFADDASAFQIDTYRYERATVDK